MNGTPKDRLVLAMLLRSPQLLAALAAASREYPRETVLAQVVATMEECGLGPEGAEALVDAAFPEASN